MNKQSKFLLHKVAFNILTNMHEKDNLTELANRIQSSRTQVFKVSNQLEKLKIVKIKKEGRSNIIILLKLQIRKELRAVQKKLET